MALTKPILYTPPAFDATQPYTFTFNVIGGDQVVANKLTIINQQTNAIVYQEKILGYTFNHNVPANSLSNGIYYSAYINTYNVQDEESIASSSIQFYCFEVPYFEFTNIPLSNIINNSSYNFEVTYNQSEGEELSSYDIVLYDDERSQISTSGTKYISGEVSPITVSYIFSGFENNQTYYVKASGVTNNGMQISTDFIRILVSYEIPEVFSAIGLINNCNGGYVTVKSNLLDIEGISQPSPPIYLKDTMVDLRSSGSFVEWNENFIVNNNFVASLWGKSFNENSQIIELTDNNGNNIIINYMKAENGTYYLDMTVTEDGESSHIYSQQVPVWASFNKQQIWLKKVNSIYTIELHNLEPEPASRSAILGQGLLGWMILGEDEI